jgi:hypothetical protein
VWEGSGGGGGEEVKGDPNQQQVKAVPPSVKPAPVQLYLQPSLATRAEGAARREGGGGGLAVAGPLSAAAIAAGQMGTCPAISAAKASTPSCQ